MTIEDLVNDYELDKLEKMLDQLNEAHRMRPTKISIEFEHKRFSEKATAKIEIPFNRGQFLLGILVEKLRHEIEEITAKKYK